MTRSTPRPRRVKVVTGLRGLGPSGPPPRRRPPFPRRSRSQRVLRFASLTQNRIALRIHTSHPICADPIPDPGLRHTLNPRPPSRCCCFRWPWPWPWHCSRPGLRPLRASPPSEQRMSEDQLWHIKGESGIGHTSMNLGLATHRTDQLRTTVDFMCCKSKKTMG